MCPSTRAIIRCVEKADLVQRLLASGTVRLIMAHEAVAVEPSNSNQ